MRCCFTDQMKCVCDYRLELLTYGASFKIMEQRAQLIIIIVPDGARW